MSKLSVFKNCTTLSVAGASSGEAPNLEQEKYLRLLVAATPSSHRSEASDSLTSLDSLVMAGVGGLGAESFNILSPSSTPEHQRHLPQSGLSKADTLDKRVSSPIPATLKSKSACKFSH